MRFSSTIQALAVVLALPLFALSLPSSSSPVLAGPIGKDCIKGSKHEGKPQGRNITLGGVPTYLASPSHAASNKVILFYSDVFGSFYLNNQLVQDYFATQGYHVVGVDYFLGDPIGNHISPDFIPFDPNFDINAWIEKSRTQAETVLPKWHDAVRKRYGANAKYSAVGYCFGALYSMRISATDQVVAAAFAHPGSLTEDHFNQLKKPLLLSCAERDSTFPAANLNRAVEILTQNKARYHVQIFSGTEHGFAVRANLSDENAVWVKEESARSVVKWFERFSK